MLHWPGLHLQPINLWSLPNGGFKMDNFVDVDFCSAAIDKDEHVAMIKSEGSEYVSFYITNFATDKSRVLRINGKSEAKKVYDLLGKLLGE